MRVFNAWNQSLRQATNNTVSLRFYSGGSQGDERDFVRKMRAGQMDGAAVTSTGLGLVVRPVLVLSAPGLFEEYAQIDRVRTALAPELEAQFMENGYKLLGWGDVGRARLFSKNVIRRPTDLRSQRPWAWRDDLLFTEFLNVIGANGVRLGVPEVYPALQTGMIDALPASPLAAVALQWYTQLRYVTSQSSGILIGATILRKDKFEGLTADQRRALLETSNRAHRALAVAIRRDDERAYTTIQQRGIQVTDTRPFEQEWRDAGNQTRERLAGRVFPRELLARVERELQAR
jgi:TRAP-type C4-dicarboxylate transport system substrate-binding protein